MNYAGVFLTRVFLLKQPYVNVKKGRKIKKRKRATHRTTVHAKMKFGDENEGRMTYLSSP